MRIPIPERFSLKQTLLAATVLLLAQLAEGTDPLFALLTFAYVWIFALSFNVAGGLFYPSGSWIFFTGTLTALVGLVYKVFLLEPGESHLVEPNTTMLIYCAGLGGMGLAAWLSRALRPERGLLSGLSVGSGMKQSAIGCLVFGVAVQFLTANAQFETGTVVSALSQLNHFVQLSIILATTYEIQHSGGKSSTNWVVWVAGAYLFVVGLLAFSKEGMLTPFTSWLVVAIVLRFDFSRKKILLAGLAVFFILYYLVPYSQYGRRSRDSTGNKRADMEAAIGYLTDLNGTRALYLQSPDVANIDDVPHLYDRAQGLFDRLQMLAFDDALISLTDQGSVYGLAPAFGTFANTIPRFIWRDKPEYKSGNVYGRQIGVIAENDESTGISFSPTSDAYHEAQWFGVIVVEPIIMFILFIVADSLSGDVRVSPWGLLFIALFVHMAPEGELPGPIWMATFGAEGVIFAALFSGYAMPWISRLIPVGRPRAIASSRRFVMAPSPRLLREAANGGRPTAP